MNIVNLDPIYKVLLYVQDIGLRILFSISEVHTAEIILIIYRRRKAAVISCNFIRYKPRTNSMREKQLFFLQGIPGIGHITAVSLLTHFQTIRKILNSTKTELSDSKRVGKKLAGSIQSILNHTTT